MTRKSPTSKKVGPILEWGIKPLFIAIIAGLVLFFLQDYFSDQKANKKVIRQLWKTLVQVDEIEDTGNKGPDPEMSKALQVISYVEKARHHVLWKKHVEGSEGNFENFLNNVVLVVKLKHRATYDRIALIEKGATIVASADVNKSWTPEELPIELTSLAHEIMSRRSGNENIPFLPYAMIDKWNYQSKGKVDSKFPTIDLTDATTRILVSKIATDKNSLELEKLVKNEKGILFPTFKSEHQIDTCFKYDTGIVEIDTSIEYCKPLAQKYLAATKASAELSKETDTKCRSDIIRLSGANVDIDPCADPNTYTGSALCKKSIEAYIRKMSQSSSSQESTHRAYLLNNCKKEIEQLEKAQRALFDAVPSN